MATRHFPRYLMFMSVAPVSPSPSGASRPPGRARRACARLLPGALLGLALAARGVAEPAQVATPARLTEEFNLTIRPLVQKYCIECHSEKKKKGKVNLQQFTSLDQMRQHIDLWENALEVVTHHDMPPADDTDVLPTDPERAQLVAWIRGFLDAEATAAAGDPGRVVLRRLSNVEYRHTMNDLIGVDLDPLREFPADNAAGEGFTNTGEALVMSPALLDKYLAAAKDIANHAVLLPDGIRFSTGSTREEWASDAVNRIRAFYAQYADPKGAIPLERYLAATIEERTRLAQGDAAVRDVAAARQLNARYLGDLFALLDRGAPSPVLDPIRVRWRAATGPDAARELTADIRRWQRALSRFNGVGKFNPWVTPATPLAAAQPVTLRLPAIPRGPETSFFLEAGAAGERDSQDVVVWQQPRFAVPGHKDVLLRDTGPLVAAMNARSGELGATTAQALAAAQEAAAAAAEGREPDLTALAGRHGVAADLLGGWLDYLQIGPAPAQLSWLGTPGEHPKNKFLKEWRTGTGANLRVNTSEQRTNMPARLEPHTVALEPAPNQVVAVGWESPLNGRVRVEGQLTDAQVGAGDGVAWALEIRRGAARLRFDDGLVENELKPAIGPFREVEVRKGDLLVLTIDPIGSAVSDITTVDLKITSADGPARTWDLAADLMDDALAGNPRADRYGHARVWHFFTEPVTPLGERSPGIPLNSVLARWSFATDPAERMRLADELQQLLVQGVDPRMEDPRSANAALYRQLFSLGGPLALGVKPAAGSAPGGDWGVAASRFGPGPGKSAADDASLAVQAPETIEVRLPANLIAGTTFKTTAVLDPNLGRDGAVQVRVLTQSRPPGTELNPALPVLVNNGSPVRAKLEAAFADFRTWLPIALSYSQVFVWNGDERYFREDEALGRLMLDEAGRRQLDALWAELHFAAQDALTNFDAYVQQTEEDADLGWINRTEQERRRQIVTERKAGFIAALAAAEPRHLDAVVELAAGAFRRPLTAAEAAALRELYATLRRQDIDHAAAVRLTIARLFISPAFLYRVEDTQPGPEAKPVSPWELASRLSYFLWSSMPDEALRREAAAGALTEPAAAAQAARRLAADDRVRALATEFAAQWLHVRDLATLDEKSERFFPTFASLRGDMYEETVRFFTDLFQRNGSIIDILDADHTFLNERLAGHYAIPGVTGPEWRRVDGVKQYGRGGVIGMASVLSKQSGASRTSPILRGNWIVETLLGDKLPDPPPNVPQLPENEADTGELTIREITRRHTSVPECASCHVKIDPFGFALEKYDAIGRRRDKDQAGRVIDVVTELVGRKPAHFADLSGMRDYLLAQRRDEFVRNFCRKLLGFALARRVQPSDYPLLDEMQAQLAQHDYRFLAAVETIVRSPQFRQRRGLAADQPN